MPKMDTSENPKKSPTIIRNIAKTNRFLFKGGPYMGRAVV
jgi:hypothetical protein